MTNKVSNFLYHTSQTQIYETTTDSGTFSCTREIEYMIENSSASVVLASKGHIADLERISMAAGAALVEKDNSLSATGQLIGQTLRQNPNGPRKNRPKERYHYNLFAPPGPKTSLSFVKFGLESRAEAARVRKEEAAARAAPGATGTTGSAGWSWEAHVEAGLRRTQGGQGALMVYTSGTTGKPKGGCSKVVMV